MKYQRFLLIPAVLLAVGGYVYAQVAQTYSGNSAVAVGTSPVLVVNQGGKAFYDLHNRSGSQDVICWPVATNSAPAASPTPGTGVVMREIAANTDFTDVARPEQPRDPFLSGWACSEPTSTSTATMDGLWR